MRIFHNTSTAVIPALRQVAGKLLAHYVKEGPGVFGAGFRNITQHQVQCEDITNIIKTSLLR